MHAVTLKKCNSETKNQQILSAMAERYKLVLGPVNKNWGPGPVNKKLVLEARARARFRAGSRKTQIP